MRIDLNALPDCIDVVLDPADSLLVVTDGRTDPRWEDDAALDRWRSGLKAVARIVDLFRANSAPVVLVDTEPLTPAESIERWGIDRMTAAALEPQPDDVVVGKTSYDCFLDTDLNATVNRIGLRPCRSQVVVAGNAVSVDCGVRGFRSRQFLVYYPEDAIISANDADALLAASLTMFHPRACYNIGRTESHRLAFGRDAGRRDPLLASIDPSQVDAEEPLLHAVTTDGAFL